LRPEFDRQRAASFVGKHVIIGLSWLDGEGDLLERRQMHGTIVRVSEGEGIVVELSGSREEYKLPPDTSAFEDAPPGEYEFTSTGEIVVDPDLLTTWTVHLPSPESRGE
jgi:hypothetical protein